VVAFDPYTTTYGDSEETDEFVSSGHHQNHNSTDLRSMGVCSCDSANHAIVVGPDGKDNQSQCPSCAQSPTTPLVNNKPNAVNNHNQNEPSRNLLGSRLSRTSESAALRLSVSENTRLPACYRLGSVSQDTQLCLWDLTEDILKQPFGKSRPTTTASGRVLGDASPLVSNLKGPSQMNGKGSPPRVNSFSSSGAKGLTDKDVVDSVVGVVKGSRSNPTTGALGSISSAENGNNGNSSGQGHGILSLRFAGISFGGEKDGKKGDGKEHRRNFSLGSKGEKNNSSKPGNSLSANDSLTQLNLEDPLKLIGTQACPRLDECPLLEPLICKKISHERLTALIFREEAIVTACQDGVICTWARPGEDFRIANNYNRKKYTNSSLAQDNIFNRFYSKGETIEPL